MSVRERGKESTRARVRARESKTESKRDSERTRARARARAKASVRARQQERGTSPGAAVVGPYGIRETEIEEAGASHPKDKVARLVADVFACEARKGTVAAAFVAAVATAVSTLIFLPKDAGRHNKTNEKCTHMNTKHTQQHTHIHEHTHTRIHAYNVQCQSQSQCVSHHNCTTHNVSCMHAGRFATHC